MASSPSMLHSKSKVPTRAVLIGINYRAWPYAGLDASYADVEEAEKFLLKIGMDHSDIRIITDKKNKLAPTKKTILEAFKWLKDGALDGDVLYIHYSGHGTEVDPPYDNPLNRTSSKAICPIDLFHADVSHIDEEWPSYDNLTVVNPITGEDIHKILGHLEDSQVNLTVVYDCCFSTGSMRALCKVPAKTSIRGLPVPKSSKLHKKITRKVKAIDQQLERDEYPDREDFAQRYAMAELNPPYVIGFAAAEGWEAAEEAEIASKTRGAFSFFFYKLLASEAKGVNGQAIIQSVRKVLSKYDFEQHPTLTTPQKLVPFFADFTAAKKRSLEYEELSNPRLIRTEEVYKNYEVEKEKKQPRVVKTRKQYSLGDETEGSQAPKEKGGIDGDNFSGNRNLGDLPATPLAPVSEAYTTVARSHVQQMVSLYSQISANPELQKLRQQERGLFDSLLKHAIPFALNAASSAVKALAPDPANPAKRDIGNEIAVQQHLPTALNLAHQLLGMPELQENRGIFDKLFSKCMPIVLSTAQQLLGAKRGLENNPDVDSAQRGLFEATIGKLPSSTLNVVSETATRGLGNGGEERGFLDILKKVAPIILNVAGTAVSTLNGQRSLSFNPPATDRGFFDSLKNVINKVVSNPLVQSLGTTALNAGVQAAASFLAPRKGQRGVGDSQSIEYTETHVRGFFGSMLQSLTPIAMAAFQGLASGAKRSIVVPVQERGIFDVLSSSLPAVVQLAEKHFNKTRPAGSTAEDEAKFLQRILTNAAGPIIQAVQAPCATIATANLPAPRDILVKAIGDANIVF